MTAPDPTAEPSTPFAHALRDDAIAPREAGTRVAGVDGLLAVSIASLVLLCFHLLAEQAVLAAVDFASWYYTATGVVWLAVSVATTVACHRFWRGRADTDAAPWAQASFVLQLVSALVALWQLVAPWNWLPSGGLAGFLGFTAVYVAADVALAVALQRTSSLPSWWTPGYIATRIAPVVPSTILIAWRDVDAGPSPDVALALSVGRGVLHVIAAVLLVAIVIRVRRRGGIEAGVDVPRRAAPTTRRDVLVGALWLGGGVVVTLGSFVLSGPGEHFVVTTGAIVYGLVRLLRGLSR